MSQKMKNNVQVILFITVGMILYLCLAAQKDLYYFTAESVQGEICSDTYIDKHIIIGFDSQNYQYKVKYAVDGVEYESKKYLTTRKGLTTGDIVTVYYDANKPGKVVEKRFPVWGIIIVCYIAAVIALGIQENKKLD